MKLALVLPTIFVLTCFVHARPVRHWTYEQLTAEADLVVIATPTASQDTQTKTAIPNVQRVGADGKGVPIPAVEVETRFAVLAVLKGGTHLKEFVLAHLKETEPVKPPVPNGPQLVSFEPKSKQRFLLFLKREADGRFVAVTGKVDPAVAIKDLGAYP